MKKLCMLILCLMMISAAALGETAREYCDDLESALPGADFVDETVDPGCAAIFGADYELLARTSSKYGSYIAGVRKTPLPEGARVDSYGGSFAQRVWRAVDGKGEILYKMVLANDVAINAYDGLSHLLISLENDAAEVFLSASDRARLEYANEKGYVMQDAERSQLCMLVHDYESWSAGITNDPTMFYLNVDAPVQLLGSQSIPMAQATGKYATMPVGLYFEDGGTYELVYSKNGAKGVSHDGRLYLAGRDFDRLMQLAVDALGYRPGDMNFMQETPVRARFEWQDGEDYHAGRVETEDPAVLARLQSMLEAGNYTIGNVNCPSPCFLVMEYEDGTRAELAVAINSFETLFYRGVCIGIEEDLIELLGLKNTPFLQSIWR